MCFSMGCDLLMRRIFNTVAAFTPVSALLSAHAFFVELRCTSKKRGLKGAMRGVIREIE